MIAREESKVLYGIYSRVEEDANYGKYEKATAVAEGDYLIVCENQSVAFDGSLAELDGAGKVQSVSISDGVLTLANADNYVFTIASVTGGYSIQAASGKYIGQGSDANGMTVAATVLVNTISITNGDADIIGICVVTRTVATNGSVTTSRLLIVRKRQSNFTRRMRELLSIPLRR